MTANGREQILQLERAGGMPSKLVSQPESSVDVRFLLGPGVLPDNSVSRLCVKMLLECVGSSYLPLKSQ